ncbi:MAG TPA: hypothetical protein VFW33_14860, partial [Gemmataceae bacterium]|nr:hypothetical protein [Gemmataceae bacterium]
SSFRETMNPPAPLAKSAIINRVAGESPGRRGMRFFGLGRRVVPVARWAAQTLLGHDPVRDQIELIEEKTAPLRLKALPGAPRRVNLLIPTLDFQYVFGGYITKFSLARRLAREGLRVRLVAVDWCDYQPDLWRRQCQGFPGLEDLLDHVEVVPAFGRAVPLEVSPADRFIATTWWTAHVAHAAAAELGTGPFLYLIQEYEPFTFPMGSLAAVAAQSYTFPHRAAFSSELLREHFRLGGLGVYAGGPEAGDRDSISFQNAITAVGEVTADEVRARPGRRLLFYARPEPHAARNMFELGVVALRRAVREGAFPGVWEFHGIGSLDPSRRLALSESAHLRVMPRQSQAEYARFLRGYGVGLCLMYTPHPSLVPIEMASAGLLTVTNTFANKTAGRLTAISPNLLGAPPTVEGIVAALGEAASRVTDYEGRARGARVAWSTGWDQTFDAPFLARIRAFLGEDAPRAAGTAPAPAAVS